MNEFIEKLIDKIENEAFAVQLEKGIKEPSTLDAMLEKFSVFRIKEIVNQLAEEYNKESVKTNADYIRNMTNDELTTFLSSIDHITDEGDRLVVFEGEAMHDNIVDIEIWLKEEREPKGE